MHNATAPKTVRTLIAPDKFKGHLEDNLTGATIELTDDEFEALSKATA